MGRRRSLVVLAALVLCWGSVLVDPGPNQNAHMARVTALAHDTPRIDRYRNWTRDTAYIDGHYYAAKAPGLAIVSIPWYFVLKGTGLLVHGPPPSVKWPVAETVKMPYAAPWEFALWGSLLPFAGLLLLVRSAADSLVPGYGLVTAVTLGAGSLVAVFATVFFDHELSALLAFLAFVLLLRERMRPPHLQVLVAAGIAAGFATGVEFPLAIVACLLGFYAVARENRLRRAIAYGAGVAIGVAPVVAYNVWAFGSITSVSYRDAVVNPGKSGHDVIGANASGFFGIGVPHPGALTQLLLEPKGLLVLAPVWAIAVAGLAVLWRNGRRAESLLSAAVCGAFLLYDAGYYLPFGGFNDGPRFLVPMLPFLALGVAAAWRAYPGPTLALACASVTVTTVSILANPMLVSEDVGVMFHRLERGGDQNGAVSQTILRWVTGDKLWPLLLVGVIVAVAAVVAFAPVARRLTSRDVGLGLAALVAWRIAYSGGAILARAEHGWIAAAVLALTLAGAIALLVRGRTLAALPAVALLVLLWPSYAGHTRIAFATISLVLVAMVALAARRPRRAALPATA